MESNLQTQKRISAWELRPSPHSSQSQIQKSSRSPGRRISLLNVPPIVTKESKTPLNAQSYLSARRTSFETQEDKKALDIQDEVPENENWQEEALEALASYTAFQLTLLRHITVNPRFIEFACHTQVSVIVGQIASHSDALSEDLILDFALSTGTQLKIESDIKKV